MLYLVGAAIAGRAHGMGIVHVGRAAQGFGSACGIVVARAVLRDVSHGPALAQSMALAMAVFSLGPITAPLLGYGLVVLGGWRGVFAAMAVFGALMLVWAQLWFKETHAHPDAAALRPARLLQSLRRIFSNRQSRYFLILSAATQFGIISFIANAPRFFKSAFDIEGLEFALLFACTGLGIVVGQIANNRLIARLGVLVTTQLAAFDSNCRYRSHRRPAAGGSHDGHCVRLDDVMIGKLMNQFPTDMSLYYYRGRANLAAKQAARGQGRPREVRRRVAVGARELPDAKKILEQMKDVK